MIADILRIHLTSILNDFMISQARRGYDLALKRMFGSGNNIEDEQYQELETLLTFVLTQVFELERISKMDDEQLIEYTAERMSELGDGDKVDELRRRWEQEKAGMELSI